jgi:prepilin-type processing-associated H-X9-DG protein
MRHPNVLPLLGITIDPFRLVSEWMPGGDLPRYIKNHPDTNRLELVSVPDVVCITRLLQFRYTKSQKASPTCIPVILYMGTLKGCVLPLNTSPNRINTWQAKRSCGWLWSSAHRRFWPCRHHSESGFRGEYHSCSWSHSALDCARDLERGETQSGRGHILFCDGHSRGALWPSLHQYSFGFMPPRILPGVHRYRSIQWYYQ